jgi:hypothetical protein
MAHGTRLDNTSIAILTKVNELVERHGINPCDVVITLADEPDGRTCMRFESPPSTAGSLDKFMRVLSMLGLSEHKLELVSSDQELFTILQTAASRTPEAHGRRRL